MSRLIHTERISGNAASFKGGRRYVHASDLIPALDVIARRLSGAPVLTRIEFHNPLTSWGIFHLETGLELPDSKAFSATGQLTDSKGCSHPFVVFPSPFSISDDARSFDEESLWSNCDVDHDATRVTARLSTRLSLAESISSMMKLLCRTALPQQERWWFVRMSKSTPLPDEVEWLSLRRQRIVADRLVYADISGPTGNICRVEFMGSAK